MSSDIKYKQPAFPNKQSASSADGMLLLDFFAAKAMESIIIKNVEENPEHIADLSYKIAGQMMIQRMSYFQADKTYYTF